MSDRPDLDICTCGDFRRDHKHGVGGCLLPFCAQHGMPQCRAFTFANAVTESDRLYQESIEARRPLPVSTLLSARQETIHRDPGAARAARSVKVRDKLPDYVEDLLQRYFVTDSARNVVRHSIAKAVRDAEETMRERAAKVCDEGVHNEVEVARRFVSGDQRIKVVYGRNIEAERLATCIRSLPLENA